jgi:hypothetical protein
LQVLVPAACQEHRRTGIAAADEGCTGGALMEDDLAAEFERERLDRLALEDAYRREDDPEWQRRVLADPFSIHEALHMAHVFGRMLDEHLNDHAAVLLRPELYAIASRASWALAELYQAIGNVVPDEEGRRG